jgi:hypothetical protein
MGDQQEDEGLRKDPPALEEENQQQDVGGHQGAVGDQLEEHQGRPERVILRAAGAGERIPGAYSKHWRGLPQRTDPNERPDNQADGN